MQATEQKEIKYQFGALPRGSALHIWQANISKDFTPVFFMHICENLNGFSKDGYSYKIKDSNVAELYGVCVRTVQRARAKLIKSDVVELVPIKRGVFCYRPSKTSTLKRQMCQEKTQKVTDLSKNNQEKKMPNLSSDKQKTENASSDIRILEAKNIKTYPKTTTSITKRKIEAKGGDELFKEIKDVLRSTGSSIPSDIIIKELLSEIPAEQPGKALAWALRECQMGEPIKDLRRFYHSKNTSLSGLINHYVSDEPRLLGNQKAKQDSRDEHKQRRAISARGADSRPDGFNDTYDRKRIKNLTVATPPKRRGTLQQFKTKTQITAAQRAEWEAKIEAERNNETS